MPVSTDAHAGIGKGGERRTCMVRDKLKNVQPDKNEEVRAKDGGCDCRVLVHGAGAQEKEERSGSHGVDGEGAIDV